MGPATFTVFFLIGLLIILGVIVIAGAKRRCGARPWTCSCGHANEPSARFCGRCGNKLAGDDEP